LTTIRHTLLFAAALPLLLATESRAQSAPIVTLVPPSWAKWDVSVYAGRHGANTSDIGPDWDRWYEAASYGLSASRFLTPHLSIELDARRSATANTYASETVIDPAGTPFFRTQRHQFTTTAVSGGATYQAFENRWFHPFIGGGLEVMFETQRSDPSQQSPSFRNGILIPPPAGLALPAAEARSTTVRPYAGTGFKVYVSPHAFLKTDVRLSLSRRGAESAVWRAGVGLEF
jgi:hypothetical protein